MPKLVFQLTFLLCSVCLVHGAMIAGAKWVLLRHDRCRCRRAAHFATFQAEGSDDENVDNVHVGGDEVCCPFTVAIPQCIYVLLLTMCARLT